MRPPRRRRPLTRLVTCPRAGDARLAHDRLHVGHVGGGRHRAALADALGLSGPQLVALVGAGGKTTALQELAGELAAAGEHVLATTTTMMLARQLSSLGPLLLEDDDSAPLAMRAGVALRGSGVVTLAHSLAADGKVKGLSPAAVDGLWAAGLTLAMVVEADGSRGLPLKAFGAAEPQLPLRTTTVVVLAGLDALGLPLDEDHVHRAGLLTSILGVAPGDTVTPEILGAAVRLQVACVRALAPDARVTVLLNKVDREARAGQGALAAVSLLEASDEGRGGARPDRVVVGSVLQHAFTVMYG